MQGIGPGTILGGRYTADRRIAQYAGAERWTARDTTLDRAVVLFTVPRGHPNVDAVLDAARRSAGLDNARLSRILDVGTDDDVAYVVEESLEGSHSLATLLSAGPLPAPEVRRIAGETALVLDLARHRGLHHQRLTPDLVLRTVDGDVKVRGLATMAALAGVDDVGEAAAARTDAMAVVALAYAGFTGHWPLGSGSGGLPPAPRVASHVAAPSEIAVGVPADLDALCRLTFANNQGPVTPGDFARQIAPWSPIPVLLPSLDPPEQSELSHSGGSARRPRPSDSAPSTRVPDHSPVHGAEGPAAEDADTPTATAPAGTPAPSSAGGTPTPSTGTGTPVPVARRVPPRPDARPGSPLPGQAVVPATAPPGTKPFGKAPSGTKPPGTKPPGPQAEGTRAEGTRAEGTQAPGQKRPKKTPPGTTVSGPPEPSPLAAMTAATTAALGSAGAATVSAARTLSGRLNDWSASTKDRARVAVDDVRARREESTAARSAESARSATEQRSAPSGPHPIGAVAPGVRGHDRHRDLLEPPAPLLPASAGEPLTRDQSRMAIGIVVGFLLLVFVLAVWGLSSLSLPALSSDGGTEPVATGTPTAGETEAEGDADGDGTPDAPPAGAPLTFTTATDFDPLGDGEERPEELALILDGDDSTDWGSEGYLSSAFSGLKAGLGIVLDLGATSSVSEVTLVLPHESAGRIYVTDDAGYAGEGKPLADDLAEAGTFDGSGTVTTELIDDASGRYVIVWFTEISSGGEQWYRARLAGASATS